MGLDQTHKTQKLSHVMLMSYFSIQRLNELPNVTATFLIERIRETLAFFNCPIQLLIQSIVLYIEAFFLCIFLLPQWQKSLEMTNSVLGSKKYLANSSPYSFSDEVDVFPTIIGTILNLSFLLQKHNNNNNNSNILLVVI